MVPVQVAPVKNGKVAAKAPGEESSDEEDSDDDSDEEVKVFLVSCCPRSRDCF